MYKKVRIGFIGCGVHATSQLYPTIHRIPEIDLVAVCDQKKKLAVRNARHFGARRWYTNVEKMLSREKIDGAIIVGPPRMHCEVGRQCLERGIPIFVEKPSAVSFKEAKALAQYAQSKGLFGAVAYMKRFSTCYRMAKFIISKKTFGKFGKINEIELRFSHGPYPKLWGIKEEARAFLIGQVVHIFNLIRFFCGEVDEVYARRHDVNRGRFGYAINVTFKNGIVGVLNLNTLDSHTWKISEYVAISGYEKWLEIKDMVSLKYHFQSEPIRGFGTAGRSQLFAWEPEWAEISYNREEMFGYQGEVQNFARAVLNKEKPGSTLWDGAKDLEIAEAVWNSSQTKKPVNIGKV